MDNPNKQDRPKRRPEWIRVRAPSGETYQEIRRLMRSKALHTVCEEARCPNMGECWGKQGTATFLILGGVCTRSCRFCDVTTGKPDPLDWDEPERVAQAVQAMNLRHVVITSVNRDDRRDGGAPIFAAHPDILNHNVETVRRLFRTVQPQDRYEWAEATLRNAKVLDPHAVTKSGIMVGLGETFDEVVATMQDLREWGVDVLTVGQYLQPSAAHMPIDRFYAPAEFAELKRIGLEMGFRWVESGPLVRSSYNAEKQADALSIWHQDH
jgi:lipoic acid synthetase